MKELENNKVLEESLIETLNNKKYFNNIELINSLASYFTKKGLPRSIPNKLFSNSNNLQEVNFIQLICFMQGLHDYGEQHNIPELNVFKPSRWYSDLKLKEFHTYVNIEALDTINKVVFKNVDRIGEYQYICSFASVHDIAKMKNNQLLTYNFNTQREAKKIRTIGTNGNIVRTINVNDESVKAISNLIFNNKFTPNLITLNVPILGIDNSEKIEYDENTRTLTITPDYSADSNTKTFIEILDGYHRITASCLAVEEADKIGKRLANGFIVSINNFTPQEAAEHFKRECTVNPVGKEYLKTFETSDEGKFAKAMVEYNDIENILNNNVLRTFEETKSAKKLTYYKVLEDGIRQTDINVSNSKSIKFTMPIVVEFINKVISELKELYGFKSNKELKDNTVYLDINIFIGYIKAASLVHDKDSIDDAVDQLVGKIINKEIVADLEDMKLNNKIYAVTKISEYFNNLMTEV